MKKDSVLLSLLAIVFAITGCAPTVGELAIENAKKIDFDLDTDIPAKDYCIVRGKVDVWIHSVDRKVEPNFYAATKQIITKPGPHTITVFYRTDRTMSSHVDMFLRCRGDIYYIDYKMSGRSISFSFAEPTEPEMLEWAENFDLHMANQKKYKQEYLAFSEANPKHLDGVWNGLGYMNKLVQITIKEGELFYKHTPVIGGESIIGGILKFNENTIIFNVKSHTISGKPTNYGLDEKHIWYYELKDGILNILKAPWIVMKTVEGEYEKR